MEKFRYSMQNILNVKEKMEAQEKLLFQIATENVREEEKKLDALFKKKASYEELLRESMSEKLDVNEMRTYRNAISNTEDRIKTQRGALRIAEQKLEEERLKLVEAMKEKKMYERLREKAYDAYLEDEKHDEGVINDEHNSYVYGTKEG